MEVEVLVGCGTAGEEQQLRPGSGVGHPFVFRCEDFERVRGFGSGGSAGDQGDDYRAQQGCGPTQGRWAVSTGEFQGRLRRPAQSSRRGNESVSKHESRPVLPFRPGAAPCGRGRRSHLFPRSFQSRC